MAGVRITGVRQEILHLGEQYAKKKVAFMATGRNIAEDWLKESRANAPVREGTLADSGTCRVTDRGNGNGIIISVGFNTPYAMRMHEAHYQAFPREHVERRRSKRTGRVYYKYDRTFRTPGGLWGSARGKHGRKFITRVLDANLPKYIAALQATAVQP